MDDVLSLPARLWRSITGDSAPPPLPPPNSHVDAYDESLSEQQRRIALQWKRYRKEHDTLLEHVQIQESSLQRIEAELHEADRALTAAQADLKISSDTVAELTKSCDAAKIQHLTDSLGRLSLQLANLDRVIEKRRKHLDESHFRHNALTAHAGQRTATLIRQDSFKSISTDAELADSNVEAQTKSELSDLQRQITVTEIEMQQHKNVLEALQRQADSIRLERENLEAEKFRADSERRINLGALSLAIGKAKQRQETVSRSHKKLNELMVAQLNTLMALDKGRESLTVAENMMRQLRNEERQLTSSQDQSPSHSPVMFRRHSSPDLENSSKMASIPVTLIGIQESLNRWGLLSATTRLLVFESQDNIRGSIQIAIRISSIEELSILNASLLIVSFMRKGVQNSIRFRGDPCDIESVDRVLRPRLHELREINVEPIHVPSSPQIVILGESSILSQRLLKNLFLAMPARYHFDHWKRLYTITQDGMSLNTLYRAVACSRGAFLIIMDERGCVFGAFVSEKLKVHSGYFGNGECFVFQFLDDTSDGSSRMGRKTNGHFSVYTWSGKNKFFILCRHDSISIGGGTHFAIFLQHSLREGSSGESDTFDSPILSSTRDFRVSLLEIWGTVGESPISALMSEHEKTGFDSTSPN